MENSLNSLMTRQEVARLLRVGKRTIRGYELAGKLHPVRLNRRVIRYNTPEVERLIGGTLTKEAV